MYWPAAQNSGETVKAVYFRLDKKSNFFHRDVGFQRDLVLMYANTSYVGQIPSYFYTCMLM